MHLRICLARRAGGHNTEPYHTECARRAIHMVLQIADPTCTAGGKTDNASGSISVCDGEKGRRKEDFIKR